MKKLIDLYENFMDWADRTDFWNSILVLILCGLAMYGFRALGGGEDIPKECGKVWIP